MLLWKRAKSARSTRACFKYSINVLWSRVIYELLCLWYLWLCFHLFSKHFWTDFKLIFFFRVLMLCKVKILTLKVCTFVLLYVYIDLRNVVKSGANIFSYIHLLEYVLLYICIASTRLSGYYTVKNWKKFVKLILLILNLSSLIISSRVDP